MRSELISRSTRRELGALLHQQCWCWGRDIRYACGNLLVDYGATRVAPPAGRRDVSSAYHLQRADGDWIGLWGFGVAIVPRTGLTVLIGRYVPQPQVLDVGHPLEQVWAPTDLPPRTLTDGAPAWWSLLGAVRWIASYERWVLEAVGPEWRDICTHDWEAAVVTGRLMAGRWEGLADRLEREVLQAIALATCTACSQRHITSRPTPAPSSVRY
jgi:hypothetical protein